MGKYLPLTCVNGCFMGQETEESDVDDYYVLFRDAYGHYETIRWR